MARGPRFGNPGSDSHRYVMPRPAFSLATKGALALAGVLGLLLLFQVVGFQRALVTATLRCEAERCRRVARAGRRPDRRDRDRQQHGKGGSCPCPPALDCVNQSSCG